MEIHYFHRYEEARASSPQSSTYEASGTATPLTTIYPSWGLPGQQPLTISQALVPGIQGKLTFKSRPMGRAPRTMYYGSATADSYFAYFVPGRSTEVYRYDLITDVWQEFPSCPYVNAGLVVIEGRLTAVGGSAYDGHEDEYTNELCTLNWEKLWVGEYPSNDHCTILSCNKCFQIFWY
ncbi:hypothetical protein GBAR_LOCUS11511 [Geodia barretti]|uniref:Uncharacterized protein n=1 Tax=Geodia barretti TaxID=519541 RepID=A0AA35RZ49_GEOBA|nr:hypothetical protein GBAR_LOCUS11511 [Geodia barretti]